MAFQDFVDTSSDATFYRYGYNGASELESAVGYRGTNPAATTRPLLTMMARAQASSTSLRL